MKGLYEAAIDLIGQIKGVESCIEAIANEGTGRVLLRTEECISGSYAYANVRPSAYGQFLNGELKSLQKDLKVIEAEIKRKISR